MRQVQVKPCIETNRVVTWCEPSEAAFFGVYVGEPGAFEWAADFKDFAEAKAYADQLDKELT